MDLPDKIQPSIDPRDISPLEFISKAQAAGITERSARQVLGAIRGRHALSPDQWLSEGLIPKRGRSAFGELPRLALERSTTSAIDGFQKLLFRTADGKPLETVIIPLHKEKAVSICVSSQVGCAMACAFCATARMPERRNLETWEIVDQILQATQVAREQGRKVTGLVFMGMGEPFLNYDHVIAAAQFFSFPADGAIAAKAITISTVGIIRQIWRYIEEGHRFRLSISLGSAIDEKRELLVPVAARTPVREVMEAARAYALNRRQRINLAYVCISGLNTTREDAQALGELIGDTPVRLDLIDVSDHTGRFLPPTPVELSTFRDALREFVPHPVERRYSGGADIRAACGTLAGESELHQQS
jgi:23S rRNA (adenine2503-C2)-methyltransferase